MAEAPTDPQAIDLERYLRVLWANTWVVILVIAVAAGGAYLWSNGQPKVFASSALVRVFDPSDPSVSSGGVHVDPLRAVDLQVLYAQSPAVVAKFKQEMGKSAARVKSTSIAAVTTTDAMTVEVDSGSKQVAETGAATYAQVYLNLQRADLAAQFGGQAASLRAQAGQVQTQINDLNQQIAALAPTNSSHVVLEGGRPVVVPETDALQNLNSQSDALGAKYADLLNQAAQADVASSNRQADLAIIQSPSVPKQPVSPLPTRNAAIAALAGLLVGLGIVVLRYRFLQRVITTGDLKLVAPEIPFVSAIPPNHPKFRRSGIARLDLTSSADGRLAESYRTLRAGLRFAQLGEDSMVLLVTSARASEGKTTTTANLAVSLAQGGERVLVMDCDLRHPNIHEVFGIGNKLGFSSVVKKPSALASAIVTVTIVGATLDVLPAGPTTHSPAELLLAPAVAELLTEAKLRYDFILLDSPPVLPVADAVTIAPLVDGLLLVVRAKRTRVTALRQMLGLLAQFDAPIQGAVLVGASHERGYGDYYYYAANVGSNKHAKRKHKQVKRPGGVSPARAPRSATTTVLQPGSAAAPASKPATDSDSAFDDTVSRDWESENGQGNAPERSGDIRP